MLSNVMNMESWLTTAILAASLVVFPLFLAYWYATKKQFNYWKERGIDGPPVLPFIGNTFSPTRPTPLLQIDRNKKYGKFYGMFLGRRPALCISDPEIIKRILVKDFPMFRNRIGQPSRHRIFSQNLVGVRDEKWKRIRSILSPLFTTSKLRRLEDMMSQCVDSLIGRLERAADQRERFLAHGIMGNFTMDVIAKCAFATDTNAHNEHEENVFVRNARAFFNFNLARIMLGMAVPEFMVPILAKLKVPGFRNTASEFFAETAFHLIRQRKTGTKPFAADMLQLMVQAEHGNDGEAYEKEDENDSHHINDGKEERETEQQALRDIIGSKHLTEEEIAAQTMIFFLAGYETTASTLTFTLYELALNTSVQDRLYEEIKTAVDQGRQLNYDTVMKMPYLDAVLSETLRKHTPVLTLTREAAEPYHIPEYNYTMQPGEGILIPVYAIHHNEEYWPEPERYDPDRFMGDNRNDIVPYSYLPFGGGPRNCIGMRFAMAEAKQGLARILSMFEVFRADDQPLSVGQSLFLLKMKPILIGVKRRGHTVEHQKSSTSL